MTSLQLPGLKAHHPLGFLAACGLLRVATSSTGMKLGWRPTGSANNVLTAYVRCDRAATEDELRDCLVKEVADSAVRYLSCLKHHELDAAEALVDQYREKGRAILKQAGANDATARTAAELLSGLGSDVTTRRKTSGKIKGKVVVRNSHLLMTSGQQDLLKKKGREPAAKLAMQSTEGVVPAQVCAKIREALFGPWRYEDDEHPLGWDPQAQRLHALRNMAPTKDDKNRSVCAAVYLASQALPLFPCFAVEGQLRTTGFHRAKGEDWFAWPVWQVPISLDTLRSLLAHPFNSALKFRGVEVVYRCCRARTGGSKGDYRVFSQSEQRPWPARRRRRA